MKKTYMIPATENVVFACSDNIAANTIGAGSTITNQMGDAPSRTLVPGFRPVPAQR